MAALVTALATDFTPAVGDFIIQVTGGSASLVRRNVTGAATATVGVIDSGSAVICSNPIAGAVYQLVSSNGATVRADQ